MDRFPSYSEVHDRLAASATLPNGEKRFVRIPSLGYLDTEVYAIRCEILAEMFLAEANARAAEKNAKAFCHIVGLGLGVWQIHHCQAQIQVEAYATVLQRMSLPHVGELHFSWFSSCSTCGGAQSGEELKAKDNTPIRIVFDRRNPADKLPEP